MKYIRTIAFTTAAMLSVGSLMLLAKSDNVELNRHFEIETTRGDIAALKEMGLKTIVKSGQNQYESVTLSTNGTEIKTTSYDPLYRVTEEVLNNKELYRGMFYPATYESDDIMITAQFDHQYPYNTKIPTLNIRMKNKSTDQVIKMSPILNDITPQDWVGYEYITQVEGQNYYVAIAENWYSSTQKVLIYAVNFNEQYFELTHKIEMQNIHDFAFDGRFVYGIKDGKTLISLDILTQDLLDVPLSTEITEAGYPSLLASNGHLFVQTDLGITNVDPNTGQPSFAEFISLTATDHDTYAYVSELNVINQTVYVMLNTYNGMSTQPHVLVFDLKTGDVFFEGNVLIRNDQGMIRDYELTELH